jgi:hypothetical protein
MVLCIQLRAIQIQIEISIFCGQLHHFDALDQFFAGAAKFDQIRYGANLQPMFFGEFDELGQTRHGTIVTHDLTNDSDRTTGRQLDQVHCRFGMASALQNAAGAGPQRKHVARLNQVVGHSGRFRHNANGFRAIGRADTGGNPF